jgi:hypothetical protein
MIDQLPQQQQDRESMFVLQFTSLYLYFFPFARRSKCIAALTPYIADGTSPLAY